MKSILSELVHELLRYKSSSDNATKAFEESRHNDYLCPLIEQQGNRILDCFVKYHSVAYDVQGINDRGTDVLLRYYEKSEIGESESKFIAFQIKSFNDLNAKNYLRELKAQCLESLSAFGEKLDQYYIILCTNKITHRNKIRQIKNAFASTINVTVIDPSYALTFLRLSPLRINSVVSILMRDDDIVYERAIQTLTDFAPTEIAVFLAIVYEALQLLNRNRSLNLNKIVGQNFIIDVFSKVPDYSRDYYGLLVSNIGYETDDDETDNKPIDLNRELQIRFAEAVDSLEGSLFSFDGDSYEIVIDFDYSLPVQAIILENMVRYEYRGDQLLTYLFDSLGILEHFNIESVDNNDNWEENFNYSI